MLPRWFRVAVLLEVLGVIALVVFGIHLLQRGGGSPLGDIVHWTAPSPARHSAAPHIGSPDLPLPSIPPASAPIPAQYLLLPANVWSRLSRDTGATAVGEYALLLDLEAAVRLQIEHLIAAEELR